MVRGADEDGVHVLARQQLLVVVVRLDAVVGLARLLRVVAVHEDLRVLDPPAVEVAHRDDPGGVVLPDARHVVGARDAAGADRADVDAVARGVRAEDRGGDDGGESRGEDGRGPHAPGRHRERLAAGHLAACVSWLVPLRDAGPWRPSAPVTAGPAATICPFPGPSQRRPARLCVVRESTGHVHPDPVQPLRQADLGGLRPARRAGDGGHPQGRALLLPAAEVAPRPASRPLRKQRSRRAAPDARGPRRVDRQPAGRKRSIGRSEALMDEAPWFRHYEKGVPRAIPYPEITLPEALDQTADALSRPRGTALLPRRAAPGADPDLPAAAGPDAALRDGALPARRAQGRPRRAHAAELPAARGRLLRGAAHRRHPGQHEPDVRVAGDAGAVRGLRLRDGGAPRPVLPAPEGDPRGHARPARDRRRRRRDACRWHARLLVHLAQARRGERVKVPAEAGHLPLPGPRRATRPRRPARTSSPPTWRSCSTRAAPPARRRPRCSRTATSSRTASRRAPGSRAPGRPGDLPGRDPVLPRLRPHLGAALRRSRRRRRS